MTLATFCPFVLFCSLPAYVFILIYPILVLYWSYLLFISVFHVIDVLEEVRLLIAPFHFSCNRSHYWHWQTTS